LLREWIREYRRPVTPEESEDFYYGNQKWRQIKESTGLLELKITTYPPSGVPNRWREEEHTIEEKLSEILAALITILAERAHRREEAEADRQRQIAAAAQAKARDEERKREAERRDALLSAGRAWKDAGVIRDFVAAVRASVLARGTYVPAEQYDTWATWALGCADDIDPLCTRSTER